MARPISDEELQLKKRARRRLVGAIVLVTAVAVVLPMVLDSEPKPVSQNVDIQIPSPDSGEFKLKASAPIGSVPDSAAGKPSEPAKPDATPAPSPPAADSASASIAASKEQPKAQSAPAGADAADKAAKDTPKTASKAAESGAYVVQVAALADAGRAKRLEKQMAGAGVQTYTEVVSTRAGEVTRVRAGPYATREAAEKARTQLKKVGLDGKVVPK